MNIEQFPEEIKNDIEDQSLSILERIKDKIIVIGGWAVRAHLGDKHHRYTLDVDGVTDRDTLPEIRKELENIGFETNQPEWGIQFIKAYQPNVVISDDFKKEVEKVQLRIEISEPRIAESSAPHFFEFSLKDHEIREIPYHSVEGGVTVKVPPIEHMTAVKLGLPVDYKNNHDAAMLFRRSDLSRVVEVILENDNWSEMVLHASSVKDIG